MPKNNGSTFMTLIAITRQETFEQDEDTREITRTAEWVILGPKVSLTFRPDMLHLLTFPLAFQWELVETFNADQTGLAKRWHKTQDAEKAAKRYARAERRAARLAKANAADQPARAFKPVNPKHVRFEG